MPVLLANNAISTLQAGISDAVTSLTIDVADADLFPSPDFGGAEEYFILTLEDRRVVPNLREILMCTARSGAVLTVQRGIETPASAFSAGATVSMRLTAITLANLVGDQVSALNTTMTDGFNAASTALADETASRSAADDGEVTNRDAAIATAVAVEAAARASVDAALQAQRDNDITYIDGQDAAEATARIAGDATNAAALAAEVTARLARDFIRVGTLTTNGSGAFSITFAPAFPSALAYWSHGLTISGGDIGSYSAMSYSASGVSGVLLDAGASPLASSQYYWFAVGY